MNIAPGFQIAQSRPSDTSAVSVFTATLATEVTSILVCNTTGSPATVSIFHDDDGSTFDQTTALYYAKSIDANETEVITIGYEGQGVTVKPSGQLGVQVGTGSALTITFFGVSEEIKWQN